MTTYPLSALRALALHTQLLDQSPESTPTPSLDSVYDVVDHLGAVQIDTLHVVARSHYLVLWSRLGAYDLKLFDRLAYDPSQRRTFEGWQHAACFVPMHEYRYQMPLQRSLRENPSNWYTRWLSQNHNPGIVREARKRIKKEGALRVSDFERGEHSGGTWWNWRPAKVALEYLYAFGDLMISNRINFQRAYDLATRVLPKGVDLIEPSIEERDRFWIERGAKAHGVCTPAQAADYTWMKLYRARPAVAQLVQEGVLVEIKAKLLDGETSEMLVHRDNLTLLEKAASGELPPQRTTFLSPFDSLFWARGRDEAFWGFRQRLESYTPAPKRVYGYFCLPILHKDRLVGRFDPKLERKNRLLYLNALYLEPGVKADDELVASVAGAMRDFMKFHQADDLVVESGQPKIFAKKLLQAL
jgi:uncharacterized protein YcaQ